MRRKAAAAKERKAGRGDDRKNGRGDEGILAAGRGRGGEKEEQSGRGLPVRKRKGEMVDRAGFAIRSSRALAGGRKARRDSDWRNWGWRENRIVSPGGDAATNVAMGRENMSTAQSSLKLRGQDGVELSSALRRDLRYTVVFD
jgi:hypothetical protein